MRVTAGGWLGIGGRACSVLLLQQRGELGLPENTPEERCKADADSVRTNRKNGDDTLPPSGMNDYRK